MNTEPVLFSPKTQGRKRSFSPSQEEEIAARYWGWERPEESAESLSVLYGPMSLGGSITPVTIRNIAYRVRDQKIKAPAPCTSSGRNPLEVADLVCQIDSSTSSTKTEEGI